MQVSPSGFNINSLKLILEHLSNKENFKSNYRSLQYKFLIEDLEEEDEECGKLFHLETSPYLEKGLETFQKSVFDLLRRENPPFRRFGIIGHIGAGKPTLISQLVDIPISVFDGTIKTQFYVRSPQTLVIDYPNDVGNNFREDFRFSDYFIILIDGGSGNSGSIDMVGLIEKVISEKIPFLVCFTRMDKFGGFMSLRELSNRKKMLIKELEDRSPIIKKYLNNFYQKIRLFWLCSFELESKNNAPTDLFFNAKDVGKFVDSDYFFYKGGDGGTCRC